MRIGVVLRYVALALFLNAFFMFLSAGLSLFYKDAAFLPLLYSGIVATLLGCFLLIFVPSTDNITNKEGLLIVVLSWLSSCLIGVLPYILWGGVFDFTNAWFESVSGFTTTGSTILIDIEVVPKGLLFWRAATHWIGGIGIIIFVLSILPYIGIAEILLFKKEISSVMQHNFHLRARRAIQILVGVYLVLTFLETGTLVLCGMSLFDAVTHAFATIATGGFSPRNASIAYYHSTAIEVVVIIFMILSGINFVLLFSAITGKFKQLFASSVMRYYLLMLLLGVIFASLDLYLVQNKSLFQALRYASFNIISVGTSTGFATTDTAIWPGFSRLLLIFFALQCASSGSTSGGIKVDRMVILFKSFVNQIRMAMHPNAVIPIRIDGIALKEEVALKSILYIMVYLIIVFFSSVLLSAMGVDLLSAFSGTVAAMGNVGPGLGSVGSTGNFAHIPAAGKWLLSLTMLLGRLEVYALVIFITPAQWKSTVAY
ncbi:TrkH family potassium uptake protein [candidate division KSB1 bacterium]|nr:TrkH family potassium uptake protein [candidate division KSB1 bacterium]